MPDSSKSYVTPNVAEGIFVRTGAGAQFSSIASAFAGDLLELSDPTTALPKLGIAGEWIQVRTAKGVPGWVNARYVGQVTVGTATAGTMPAPILPIAPPPTPAPVAPPAPTPTFPILASGQPPLFVHTTYKTGQFVRSGPGKEYADVASTEVIDRIEALGDRSANLAKLGKDGEWIQVRTSKGVVGYAAAAYLEIFPEEMPWTEGQALVGLHGPTEAWSDRWNDAAYRMVSDARIEAVKILASNDLLAAGAFKATDIVSKLRSLGVRFILARLFAKFGERRSPQQFVDEVGPSAQALFNSGVKHFEVHNEPNLNLPHSPEGMFTTWQNGAEFAQFFQQAVMLLKQNYGLSGAYFGYPGLSPIKVLDPGKMYPMPQFLTESDAAVRHADFFCMHTYWGADGTSYLDSLSEVRRYCQMFPTKRIFVTEFANVAPWVGKDIKGEEYRKFFAEARRLPSNLGALFSYVMSSAGDYSEQVWAGSSISATVGRRTA